MTRDGGDRLNFELATAGQIVFGPGSLLKAGELLDRLLPKESSRRVLLVCGLSAARAEPLFNVLQAAGIGAEVFSVSAEPTVATVGLAVGLARASEVAAVVGMGGGSAVDAGKAIAAMATNPGELIDYLEIIGAGRHFEQPPLPYVAIPTTAGTGSEVTRNAVIASPDHRVKVSLRSPLMLPRVALVDPELTRTLPAALTASTGLDALTQVVEPLVSSKANPLTDAVCREGIRRVAVSLRVACREPDNLQARTDMSLASLCGGLALANAGLGAVHGLAGPIGGMFPAPHGAICALLLPEVMRANIAAAAAAEKDAALARYQEVAALLTGNPQASPQDGVAWVADLVAELGIARLSTYGVTQSHLGELADKGLAASSMKANPVSLPRETLMELMGACL